MCEVLIMAPTVVEPSGRCGATANMAAFYIKAKLEAVGVRVELDERSEKIGKKIRDAQLEKVPYMLVLGDKEAEAGQVAVRSRKTGETEVMTADEFVAKIVMEIATKAK